MHLYGVCMCGWVFVNKRMIVCATDIASAHKFRTELQWNWILFTAQQHSSTAAQLFRTTERRGGLTKRIRKPALRETHAPLSESGGGKWAFGSVANKSAMLQHSSRYAGIHCQQLIRHSCAFAFTLLCRHCCSFMLFYVIIVFYYCATLCFFIFHFSSSIHFLCAILLTAFGHNCVLVSLEDFA